ncbi:alpha/beta hydrolase [Aquirufa sp. HETE-83D]|uniref:Alpha/beta hydrolase n=1 Tax=Aquirufa esocilacus TaxID=3096513 RepID=A0ABW6DKR5_9BACT
MPATQLVFLHGFGEDERVWADFLPFHTFSFPTICPAYATWTDCATLADYARKIVSFLPSDGPFILVGHSMGGYIALEIASQFPELIQKVVMLHSTFVADAAEKKVNRDRTADLLAKKGTSFFIGPFLPNLFGPAFSDMELLANLAERYRTLPAEGLIAATRAMRDRKDFTSFVQQITIPFLFILGEQDALISPESITRFVTKSVVILPNVGHQGTYEAPEAVAEAINQFVNV